MDPDGLSAGCKDEGKRDSASLLPTEIKDERAASQKKGGLHGEVQECSLMQPVEETEGVQSLPVRFPSSSPPSMRLSDKQGTDVFKQEPEEGGRAEGRPGWTFEQGEETTASALHSTDTVDPLFLSRVLTAENHAEDCPSSAQSQAVPPQQEQLRQSQELKVEGTEDVDGGGPPSKRSVVAPCDPEVTAAASREAPQGTGGLEVEWEDNQEEDTSELNGEAPVPLYSTTSPSTSRRVGNFPEHAHEGAEEIATQTDEISGSKLAAEEHSQRQSRLERMARQCDDKDLLANLLLGVEPPCEFKIARNVTVAPNERGKHACVWRFIAIPSGFRLAPDSSRDRYVYALVLKDHHRIVVDRERTLRTEAEERCEALELLLKDVTAKAEAAGVPREALLPAPLVRNSTEKSRRAARMRNAKEQYAAFASRLNLASSLQSGLFPRASSPSGGNSGGTGGIAGTETEAVELQNLPSNSAVPPLPHESAPAHRSHSTRQSNSSTGRSPFPNFKTRGGTTPLLQGGGKDPDPTGNARTPPSLPPAPHTHPPPPTRTGFVDSRRDRGGRGACLTATTSLSVGRNPGASPLFPPSNKTSAAFTVACRDANFYCSSSSPTLPAPPARPGWEGLSRDPDFSLHCRGPATGPPPQWDPRTPGAFCEAPRRLSSVQPPNQHEHAVTPQVEHQPSPQACEFSHSPPPNLPYRMQQTSSADCHRDPQSFEGPQHLHTGGHRIDGDPPAPSAAGRRRMDRPGDSAILAGQHQPTDFPPHYTADPPFDHSWYPSQRHPRTVRAPPSTSLSLQGQAHPHQRQEQARTTGLSPQHPEERGGCDLTYSRDFSSLRAFGTGGSSQANTHKATEFVLTSTEPMHDFSLPVSEARQHTYHHQQPQHGVQFQQPPPHASAPIAPPQRVEPQPAAAGAAGSVQPEVPLSALEAGRGADGRPPFVSAYHHDAAPPPRPMYAAPPPPGFESVTIPQGAERSYASMTAKVGGGNERESAASPLPPVPSHFSSHRQHLSSPLSSPDPSHTTNEQPAQTRAAHPPRVLPSASMTMGSPPGNCEQPAWGEGGHAQHQRQMMMPLQHSRGFTVEHQTCTESQQVAPPDPQTETGAPTERESLTGGEQMALPPWTGRVLQGHSAFDGREMNISEGDVVRVYRYDPRGVWAYAELLWTRAPEGERGSVPAPEVAAGWVPRDSVQPL
uniref:SH3 domain-containing protein n=1 Tax=Chromera velia CCMP2878 TaxID=1169474 RepID=A0A0G4HIE7_9ALVE|eukprot:Cvel_27944.t1-p1 / transcript=Cvel_27944.t1 / gene=Cvel_27944 / organism=Chromera_velia_CCMP2878 / gene_product=hypothetical protein / transcript_product=hypothetical protein / location=Cvel_scaffold3564:558-7972(+) / protein_length=1189 / sequence_SO=supercontig / SO=protein_coding / is_pseudo=false